MQPAKLERSLIPRESRNEKAPLPEETAPAVRLQKELLAEAVDRGASDVHLEPLPKAVQVRYRVDGLLVPGPVLPKSLQESLVSRFKITCNLNISEKRNPQDGSFHLVIQGKPLDLRVSCLPTLWGEKVVIRLLGDSRGFLTPGPTGDPFPIASTVNGHGGTIPGYDPGGRSDREREIHHPVLPAPFHPPPEN